MEARKRIFPFDKVEKGSRIVLYGLGVVGQVFLNQIEQLNWCEKIYLMDKKVNIEEWDYVVLDMNDLLTMEKDYDYIVIAIHNQNVVLSIREQLKGFGIPESKIIDIPIASDIEDGDLEDDSPLKILLHLTGGVGDGVTDIAIYNKLVELVPNVVIDIYGEPFIEFLYKLKPNIRRFYNLREVSKPPEGYDLVLQGSWWLSVVSCKKRRIRKYSTKLAEIIEATELDTAKNESLGIRVQQARILGKDKFWIMGHGGIWGINKEGIMVDMDTSFQEKYASLNLKKFVTINCGADMRYIEKGLHPTKIWPKEYFEKLIVMFRKEYPEYEVVQLGASLQEEIKGCNRYLLGEPFELVSYVLKGSLLHIDDESGLVHLSTALGTKCIALFGPTLPDVFGYKNNINICTQMCSSCAYNVSDWNSRCFKGMKRPLCMYSITPEMVLEGIRNYL